MGNVSWGERPLEELLIHFKGRGAIREEKSLLLLWPFDPPGLQAGGWGGMTLRPLPLAGVAWLGGEQN